MKSLLLLFAPALLLISCKKDNNKRVEETITQGGLWGINIGDTHQEVYRKLQELGPVKNFSTVEPAPTKRYNDPEEITSDLSIYSCLMLLDKTKPDPTNTVGININKDAVNGFSLDMKTGKMLTKWPANADDNIAIKIGDRTADLKAKLATIYATVPDAKNYQVWLPWKPLNSAYDPEMSDWTGWQLSTPPPSGAKIGGVQVRMLFSNDTLTTIFYRHY